MPRTHRFFAAIIATVALVSVGSNSAVAEEASVAAGAAVTHRAVITGANVEPSEVDRSDKVTVSATARRVGKSVKVRVKVVLQLDGYDLISGPALVQVTPNRGKSVTREFLISSKKKHSSDRLTGKTTITLPGKATKVRIQAWARHLGDEIPEFILPAKTRR